MKKFFAIVTVSLFLTAVCAPVVTVSAQEPQKKECPNAKKECTKTDKKECTKDAQKCDKKDGDKKCCDAKKKEAEKK